MTHDPLCWSIDAGRVASCACCDLIARVREDERTYAKQTSTAIMAYDEGRRDGYADALRDAAEAVADAVVCDSGCHGLAIDAIEALGGEQ